MNDCQGFCIDCAYADETYPFNFVSDEEEDCQDNEE